MKTVRCTGSYFSSEDFGQHPAQQSVCNSVIYAACNILTNKNAICIINRITC